ncbi:MAG: hypothetical protein BGO48_10425 [Mucilaginibacter sp. 44-25]|nr:MAG: hypothetical protein BGO48_10425 [Mucilaginibacter sp. 44-25]
MFGFKQNILPAKKENHRLYDQVRPLRYRTMDPLATYPIIRSRALGCKNESQGSVCKIQVYRHRSGQYFNVIIQPVQMQIPDGN